MTELKIIEVKPRTRAGSWASFAKRYEPMAGPDNDYIIDHDNLPADADLHQVWTLVDADGKLYVVPGYHTVNYMGRLYTRHGWSDVEEANPGYVY